LHFYKDKREVFLAAYETRVASEWQAVASELDAGGTAEEIARRLVALSIDFHIRWRGLRSSLLELVFADAEVRRFYRQRRRRLDMMAELRAKIGAPRRRREDDAIHVFTTERTFEAIARGELRDLGPDQTVVLEAMVEILASAFA
jgi:hypothetical protein